MIEEQLLSEDTVPVESALISSVASPLTKEVDKEASKAKYDYDNTPIVDIVNAMIIDAIKKGVSDIHLDPFENGIVIRFRIDGELHNFSIVPLSVKKNMITRVKIIAGMNITESRLPQDGAVKGKIENVDVDLRVSCLPTNMGEKIVIRILDYTMSNAGLETLGFTAINLETVKKMMMIPNGIILVTGATGSGKSTTVYSILQVLNTEDRNLITVEDPIEMNIEGINQVQVNSEIGMTFASALRSILRQDPDVIMIGEIRDSETARIAVRSAITGHLVLSTIHTNDSLNTIERLLDMDVERYLLGAAISGIISQKLARKLCPECKRLRATTEYEKKVFKKSLGRDIENVYEPVGCSLCTGGYRGRIPIHEVLLINEEIKDAISSGVSKHDLRKLVFKGNAIITMLQDGLTKVLEGETSLDEIFRLIQLDDEAMNSYEELEMVAIEEKSVDKIEETKEDANTLNEEETMTPPIIEEEIIDDDSADSELADILSQGHNYIAPEIKKEEEEDIESVILENGDIFSEPLVIEPKNIPVSIPTNENDNFEDYTVEDKTMNMETFSF